MITLTHQFQSAKADGPDSTQVQPSNWNANHVLNMATARLVGRATAGTGAAEEIALGNGLMFSGSTLALATNPIVACNITVSGNSVLSGTLSVTGAISHGGAAVASAALDIQSVTKGALLPRMTTLQRDAIVSPATGLLIFNTTSTELEVYSAGAWRAVGAVLSANLVALSGIARVRGMMIRGGASAWEGFTPTAAGQIPVFNGTDVVFQAPQIMVVVEEQNAGVNGGTFTAGAWQQRVLNFVR